MRAKYIMHGAFAYSTFVSYLVYFMQIWQFVMNGIIIQQPCASLN